MYRLILANGYGWDFVPMRGTKRWMEKFATIIGLKAKDSSFNIRYPKLCFIQKKVGKDGFREPIDLLEPKIQEGLPRSGWKAQDFQPLRFWSHPAVSDVICEIGNDGYPELDVMRMWTLMNSLYLRLLDSGGLPLHAALVERDGLGVLFVGPGGAGKSTLCQCLPRPWCAWSDDQSLIVRDGLKRYLAHPLPTWSELLLRKSEQIWNVQHCVYLAAIFFIEQSRTDEVVSIGQGEAAVLLSHSSQDVYHPSWWSLSNERERELKKKIFENSCQLAKAVPAYILRHSLIGRFWEQVEKVLKHG